MGEKKNQRVCEKCGVRLVGNEKDLCKNCRSASVMQKKRVRTIAAFAIILLAGIGMYGIEAANLSSIYKYIAYLILIVIAGAAYQRFK